MAKPKSHLEIERKYDADPDLQLPELTALPGVAAVGEPVTHRLVARYFDTADLRLAARGITLRRRRGGDDEGWHLKIPMGAGKREVHAPLGKSDTVPARLTGLVAAYTRGTRLHLVATLETERTVIHLLDETGAPLAEVADDSVTARLADPATEASIWREIEVELAAGTMDLLKATGDRLRESGAQPATSASKLGRVLPKAPPRPRTAPPPGTAGEAVTTYLTGQLDALLTLDPQARLAEFDAVHRMRVAVRRIRSALQSYRAILNRKHTDELLPELKWLADALGEVRDLEVLRMRFTDRLAALPDVPTSQTWLASLADQEEAAYKRLNTTLKQPRYFALLDSLDALIADPPLTKRAAQPATEQLPLLLKRSWNRLANTYETIATAEDPETARHETRKAAKRVRYAADLATATLGKPASRLSSNAKRVQEVFGDFQDGVIAMAYLKTTAAKTTAPTETFTLGILYGLEHCLAQTAFSKTATTWSTITPPAL